VTSTMRASQMNWAGTRTFTVSDPAGNLNVAGTFAYPTGFAGSLIKAGAGTLTLSGANAHGGLTTLSDGTLLLGASGTLNPQHNLTLSGGVLDSGSAVNFLGTLCIANGGAGTIRIGNGGELSFHDSSITAWNGRVDIEGVLLGTSLRFGTTRHGLTPAQLALMQYYGKAVGLNDDGYVVVRDFQGAVLMVR
jgi:autotransporter-associated beta strand protein